jgi:hypothetical protein
MIPSPGWPKGPAGGADRSVLITVYSTGTGTAPGFFHIMRA